MQNRTGLRRLAAGAASLLLLCGCASRQAETAWETVSDDPAAEQLLQVGAVLPAPYEILFALPDGAVETMESGVYAGPDDRYEIVKQVLPATSPAEAIRAISGFAPERLEVLELRFGSLPEYQFAWINETEEGTLYSRALLVTDEDYYYALQFRSTDRRSDAAAQQAVFASFGLFYDEGV